MIIGKNTAVPVLILLILFTSLFVSITSISQMPDKIMGGKDIYVLTSSTDRNPLRSNLDINIAYGLENMSYVSEVSPEIFVFTTINGRPITIRGVIFSKLLHLENGNIVEGHFPRNEYDALIGYRAQRFLGVKIGDRLTLLGGFTASMAIVNITGIYKSGYPTDDELIVSLSTARKLAGIGDNQISIIRVKSKEKRMLEEFMSPRYPKFSATLNVTDHAYPGQRINVTVNIENMGTVGGRCNLTLLWNNQSWRYEDIPVTTERKITATITAPSPGNYTLIARVENYLLHYTISQEIEILKKPIFIKGPSQLMANSAAMFYATSFNNENLRNVKVSIYGEGYSDNFVSDSPIQIKIPQSGNFTVRFSKVRYKTSSIEVRVYQKGNFNSLASVEPLYGDLILLKKGESVHIKSDGDIYYSLDSSSPRKTSGVIKFPPYIIGEHRLKVLVIRNETMASRNFTVYILEKYHPEIIATNNQSSVYYGSEITFQLRDEVPIINATVHYGNEIREYQIEQQFEPEKKEYVYNITLRIEKSRWIRIFFSDLLGQIYNESFRYKIIYQRDIFPPQIILPKNLRIWSGNTSVVEARDNVAVANISVEIFGRYFNATSSQVRIPTEFMINGTPYFMPVGAYPAKVITYDVNGNRNETSFTLIIDNSNEKIPPIILGPRYWNMSLGAAIFRAYDNVGVRYIECYENTTLLKKVNGSSLVLNSSEILPGPHSLLIIAGDINGNIASFSSYVFKNYTDGEKPRIIIKKTTVWSGSFVMVTSKDNTEVAKIKVYFPYNGKYYTGSTSVNIPTMQIEGDNVSYMPEGNYTLEVWAWDIFGNCNHTSLNFTINNSGERVPPIIFGDFYADLSNTSHIYRAFDNVGIKEMLLIIENQAIIRVEGNNITLNLSEIPRRYAGDIPADILAVDVNGNMASLGILLHVPDRASPQIILPKNLRIWSGNTSVVEARDNVAVANISVEIFGRYFNATSSQVRIPTEFMINGTPYFMPVGAYPAKVITYDVNGNRNETSFTLIIDNSNEKIPPMILGPEFYALSFNSTVRYDAYDNSFVSRMWAEEGGVTFSLSYGKHLILRYRDLKEGYHNITIFAKDIHGNVGKMNVTLFIEYGPKPTVSLYLPKSEISPDTTGILTVTLSNGEVAGYYNLTLIIDGKVAKSKLVFLRPGEIKNVYISIPPLKLGTHVLSVENQSVELKVVEKKELIPIDTVLKYTKNLKLSGSSDVIYRGFEISEGNVILTFASLIAITVILVFLGIYYSLLKGMKLSTIGVLRAIGATKSDIRKLIWRDAFKYLLPAMIGGIILGYAITIILNQLQILRAFGHQLIIGASLSTIALIIVTSLLFLLLSLHLLISRVTGARVIHLLGRSKEERIVKLEEVLS